MVQFMQLDLMLWFQNHCQLIMSSLNYRIAVSINLIASLMISHYLIKKLLFFVCLCVALHIVLIPHLGSATNKTRDDMAILAAQNVLNGIEGKPLIYSAY